MEKDKKGLSAFNASHLLLVSLVVLLASVRFFVSGQWPCAARSGLLRVRRARADARDARFVGSLQVPIVAE